MVDPQQLTQAAKTIRAGGLVAFPTETVYGLGANALDAEAVAGVFDLKGRPRLDPLIVHVDSPEQIAKYVRHIPESAKKLMASFWPGALSLVLEKSDAIPDIVTAGLDRVAIRCPSHGVARALIKEAGVPIAAPSANRFGQVSPTTAEHVRQQFGDRAPLLLDDGPCRVGVESTVVGLEDEQVVLLRPGGVTLEELRDVVGEVEKRTFEEEHPTSPGQLKRHYSPTTPIVIADEAKPPAEIFGGERFGLISLRTPNQPGGFAAIEVLSESGNLREAAANLFAAMRRLDDQQLDGIIARPIPETGLGLAIMDRLRRASA